MKLQTVRVEVCTAATAALLQTAVNTFLATTSLREFVSIEYAVATDGATTIYSALVVYTE